MVSQWTPKIKEVKLTSLQIIASSLQALLVTCEIMLNLESLLASISNNVLFAHLSFLQTTTAFLQEDAR